MALDATATAQVNGSLVTTFSDTNLTIGSVKNGALLVAIGWSSDPGAFTTPLNWNGTNLALIISVTNAANNVLSLYQLLNPASGNQSLGGTWTNSVDFLADAVSFSGVDQSGGAISFPNATSNHAVGGSPVSNSITSAVGDMTVAAFLSDATSTITSLTGTGITQIFVDNTRPLCAMAMDRGAGAASVTDVATFTLSSSSWGWAGTDIKAATIDMNSMGVCVSP